MSDNPEVANLTRLIMDLQKHLRNLATGNPLNRGSVRNAEGRYVAISSLAFGSVGDEKLGEAYLQGLIGGPGGVGWLAFDGPAVWVYVTGGKIRVDVAAQESAYGNNTQTYVSYGIYGPTATNLGAPGPEVVAPLYSRSVMTIYRTGMDSALAAGTFGIHTGLAEGWYYVAARYAISYSGNPSIAPYGAAYNRRLLVTPY